MFRTCAQYHSEGSVISTIFGFVSNVDIFYVVHSFGFREEEELLDRQSD